MKRIIGKAKVKVLDKAALLQKQELEIVEVDLGNDQIVFVRQMTGHERDAYEQSLIRRFKDDKGKPDFDMRLEDFRARLVAHTVCDAEGKLLLTPADYRQLSNNMSAARLEKIVNVAQKINAISEEDKEELVKNLDASQDDSSNSDSAES